RKLRYCKLCTKKIWNNPHKTNARHHLKHDHHIQIIHNPENRPIAIRTQRAIEDAMIRARSKASEDIESRLRATFNRDLFLEQQTLLIVRRRLPFNLVSWPEYRALLLSINPTIEDQLISSPTTV